MKNVPSSMVVVGILVQTKGMNRKALSAAQLITDMQVQLNAVTDYKDAYTALVGHGFAPNAMAETYRAG